MGFEYNSSMIALYLISTTVLMAMCLYLMVTKYAKNGFMCFVFALILGGGAGNMIDRVAAGYVVDFIHLSFFSAIFNFADCCVTVGASILFVAILGSIVKDFLEKRKKKILKFFLLLIKLTCPLHVLSM